MLRKIVSVFLVLWLALSLTITAWAQDAQNVTVNFTAEELTDAPAFLIENALSMAKDNDAIRLTVNVPSGTFRLTRPLHIYSNTTLHLEQDTVLVREFESANMLKTGTLNDVSSGYNGYHDIMIYGGVWDNQFTPTTCGMRFMHCRNITLKNLTVKNIYDSHHIEIGAAKNFLIENVTLTGYKRSKNTSGEAIQIDPVHSEKHFKSCRYLDDTPCCDITVKNCTFRNVFSGVGSRAGVVGSYFKNINIIGNTFENISDKAICTYQYLNSSIKNNTITNASVGIFFEAYPTKNLTAKLYMPHDKNAKMNIVTNLGCTISNNTILVKKRTGYAQSCGIGVYGGVLSKDTAQKTGLKKGRYLAGNVMVKNNDILICSSQSCGMELKYLTDSTVSGNDVSTALSTNSGMAGISLWRATDNFIKKNKIKGRFQQSIIVRSGSKNVKLDKNDLIGAQNYGVKIYDGAAAQIPYGNTYERLGEGNICVGDKPLAIPERSGTVHVAKGKKSATVKWDKVKSASGYYVYRSSKKGGKYQLVATLKKNKTTHYTDKTNKKYYYKIIPYKSYHKTLIIGK